MTGIMQLLPTGIFSLRKLKHKKWPPENAIHIIYADKIPVCAVLERKTKADYQGLKALEKGDNAKAINLFEEAIEDRC